MLQRNSYKEILNLLNFADVFANYWKHAKAILI